MAAAVASTNLPPTAPSTTYNEAREAYKYAAARLATKSAPSSQEFEIPVIDISASFSASLEEGKAVARKIHKACTTSGFFYITSHGVPTETCQAVLKLAERFFQLPAEKKDELHMRNSSIHRGYEPADFTSIAGDAETKEGYNWGYEEKLDLTGGDGKYVDLDGSKTGPSSNLWPLEQDVPGFYDTIKDYYGRVLQLARHLFRLFALSLDLPEDHFDSMTTHPGGIGRLLKYPPRFRAEAKDDQIGLGAHSDYECFTVLLCSETPGLEILRPDGHWHVAQPVKDAFIVNIADFLMRWTNDQYKSTVHRVVNRSDSVRYSVPIFFSINYDQMVEVSPSCQVCSLLLTTSVDNAELHLGGESIKVSTYTGW